VQHGSRWVQRDSPVILSEWGGVILSERSDGPGRHPERAKRV